MQLIIAYQYIMDIVYKKKKNQVVLNKVRLTKVKICNQDKMSIFESESLEKMEIFECSGYWWFR